MTKENTPENFYNHQDSLFINNTKIEDLSFKEISNIIKKQSERIKELEETNRKLYQNSNLIETISINVDNSKLTDQSFRKFIKNSL